MKIHLLPVILSATLFSGCGAFYFADQKGLEGGLAGRAWRTPVNLEPVTVAGAGVDGQGRTHLSFDVASTGDRLILAASLYDAPSAVYRLYGRSYSTQVGLGASGVSADFVDLASAAEAGESLGAVGLVGSHLGKGVTATAFQTAGVAAERAVCRYTLADWGEPSFVGAGPVLAIDGDTLLQSGPLAVSAYDQLSQVYTAYVETAANQLVLESHALGGATTVHYAVNSESSAGVPDRQVSLAFDGVEWMCTLWQDLATVSTVNSRCLSTLDGTNLGTVALSLGSEGWGHAIAGAGGLMLAAYFAQDSAGVMQVYVDSTTTGVFSGSPLAVSEGMAAGYEVLGSVSEGGAPAVVALNNDSFLVAWTAVNGSEAGVYYAVYTVEDDSWTVPELVSGQSISYDSETPIDSFALFSDHDGGAGIAIRYLSEVGASRDLSTRKMLLGRYHSSVGWLDLEARGDGCTPAAASEVAGCTHRPAGAILDNGAAVVLFQDQDADGVYRWRGVEFR